MEHCCELISEHLQRSGLHLLSKVDADLVAWTDGLQLVDTMTDTADDRATYRKQVDQLQRPQILEATAKSSKGGAEQGDTDKGDKGDKGGKGGKSSKGDTHKGGLDKGDQGKGDADKGGKRRYDEAFSHITDTLAKVQQTLQEVVGSKRGPWDAKEQIADSWPTRSIAFGPNEIGKFRMIADSITRAKRSTANCKQMLSSLATQIDHELEVLTAAEEHLKSIIMGW